MTRKSNPLTRGRRVMKGFDLGRYALRYCAVLLAFAGCSAVGSAGAPDRPLGLNSAVRSNGVSPDKRGKIKLFSDDYADPVPYGITAGPDDALWIADPGNDTIGRMTARGHFRFYRAGAEVSTGITSGPDGALWFTTAQNRPHAFIGRVATNGTVRLFNDPGGSYPQGITTGSDGALWFGESDGRIGRITTDGRVKHFKVGPVRATILSIVAGPDGALWATQTGNYVPGKIIRLETSGKVTTYKASAPQYICVGPDQALWFTEFGNTLGRITTNGKLSQFRINGSPSSRPVAIAAGSDGALWFTEDLSNRAQIGRMTLSGKVSLYDVPISAPASLEEITIGPSRDMWFVSASPAAIGRITTR
jgi:virginiamycin B lyase